MGRRVRILLCLIITALLLGITTSSIPETRSQLGGHTFIAPSANPLFFGSSGDVKIDIPKPGIAVRIEIPREFLQGVVSAENDTHFIQSNIRNDYYYYNVIDESNHWTYAWHGNASDGPCFKPDFSIRDPNAPWCVEIWNYLNGKWLNFTAPKFVLFRNLNAPMVAGIYNFTLSVANRTNSLGYPDFVNAWNTALYVPVSMTYNPASLRGWICDGDVTGCPHIRSKGVVYARNVNTNQMSRAYVNQTLCTLTSNVNCGFFNVTGLAPGAYSIQASAGLCTSGFCNGTAYSLSTYPTLITVNYGGSSSIVLPLRRAPQVCGSITYQDSRYMSSIAHSLSDHPYLTLAGFKSNPSFQLNITVEATDPRGHVFRFAAVSTDTASDSFKILTGVGVKYVGSDPYGTEFAGLPAPEDPLYGVYKLNVQVWISGYLQRDAVSANVDHSPGMSMDLCTASLSINPIVMQTGGVFSGTLEFWNLRTLETPHQAESSLGFPPTDALFGGNILIQVYDHSGLLRGTTVINGTLPNGKTSYASSNSIPFYVTGFTEYYNHSWSGSWSKADYGLPADSGYVLRVYTRGYEQNPMNPIPLSQGVNQPVTVRMTRGGAFSVTVGSYDNRFGTRAIQAQMPWQFLNLGIPVSARVYFYGSGGLTVGFVERLMVTGTPDGVDLNSFSVIFAGQNWSVRELWFFGYVPTHISNDTYTIRAYTLGYVPLNVNGVTSYNALVGFGQVSVALLIGNEIDLTVPIFANPQTFSSTREYDHAIGQVFSGRLGGAVMANLSIGTPILQFRVFGFGGMLLNNYTLLGQGHFFYVAPDATRYFDYGLDVGNYTVQLPEFGFTIHFLQVLQPPVVQFKDLFLESGVVLKACTMARIMQNGLISGWNVNPQWTVSSLSWAQVQARNDSYFQAVPTFDGQYAGVGALQLPAGVYNITFVNILFQSKTKVNFQVQWDGVYSLSPSAPLCPLGGIPGTCSATDLPIYFSLPPYQLLTGESGDGQTSRHALMYLNQHKQSNPSSAKIL